METIKTGISWIDDIIPEGLPLKSTTVITGPGGSGKPLIGETFVTAWLKKGGSVVFMSLQYPGSEFVAESIKSVTGLDINDYKEKIIFLQIDTGIADYHEVNRHIINANLVNPVVWDKVLNLASTKLPDEGPGILIFGSALNLLLFSPTYGDAIFEQIKSTIVSNTTKTYIFSVSTSAKAEEISQLEKIADNLILSRSENPPFQLFMKVLKMRDVPYVSDEVQVPIPPKILDHIKKMTDHSRNKVLPAILKT
ncbi:MAG: RAD55 family ATPase [Bacteroidales bacterium]|nr:RAD55 family ATPase [Bacteroidales bacterium]